jgi:CRP-like cAMP-binding protein
MNQLLLAMPKSELQMLQPHLEKVSLSTGQRLYEANETVDYVYFPNSGLTSLVVTAQDGSQVESSVVGREGMIGIMAVLGKSQSVTSAQVEIEGTAWQAAARQVEKLLRCSSVFESLLLRYMQVLYNQTAQNALCNKVHTIDQRFSRWMLVASDRVQQDAFCLPIEFISDMLGVEYAEVLPIIAAFERAGIISYDHEIGRLAIRQRAALNSAACECYKVLQEQFNSLHYQRAHDA